MPSVPATDPTVVRPSVARDRLLSTAAALFYADGIRNVGVDRVIAEASVTRATFYRHFPGKQSLVVAYLAAADEAVRTRVGEVPADAAGARRWLEQLTRVHGENVCVPGFRGCPFINAAAEFPDATSPVRVVVRHHRDWLQGSVAAAFTRIGHDDPASAAARWMMLRDGAMVAGYLADPATAQAGLQAGLRDLLG